MDNAIVQLVGGAILAASSFVAAGVVLANQINAASGRRGLEPRCPACGTRNSRPSSHTTLRDSLFSLFSCAPFRCRHCAARFYWHVGGGRFNTEPL